MIEEITGYEHLHLHTGIGSVLDGVSLPEEYCIRALKNNQRFLCVTDHGAMSAVPAQIRACDKYGINAILGIELYLQRGHDPNTFLHLDAKEKSAIRKSHHILAIAYNEIGYKNLVYLSSWGWLKGFYYKPRINFELLKQRSEGLIIGSCCINSEIGQAFMHEGEEKAESILLEYKEAFKENFYLELMMLDFAPQKPYDIFLIKMHDKYHIPLIITQDTHYCNPEDSNTQLNLLLLQTKRTRSEIAKVSAEDGTNFFELQDQNLWFKSELELNQKWFKDYQDIIPYELFKAAKTNTVVICEKAKNLKLDRSIKLPEIPDADEKLLEEIKKGIKFRNISGLEYKKRLSEEYDVITRKGLSSYLLIQKQVIDEARRYCIDILKTSPTNAINPGRGSSASSLVLYVLGIVDVDPIRHKLLFSRFLNESRGRTIDHKFNPDILKKINIVN